MPPTLVDAYTSPIARRGYCIAKRTIDIFLLQSSEAIGARRDKKLEAALSPCGRTSLYADAPANDHHQGPCFTTK